MFYWMAKFRQGVCLILVRLSKFSLLVECLSDDHVFIRWSSVREVEGVSSVVEYSSGGRT